MKKNGYENWPVEGIPVYKDPDGTVYAHVCGVCYRYWTHPGCVDAVYKTIEQGWQTCGECGGSPYYKPGTRTWNGVDTSPEDNPIDGYWE
jgi:hypothetical protein